MNLCGRIAGTLIRNAIGTGKTTNIVVSPLSFNVALNITARLSGHTSIQPSTSTYMMQPEEMLMMSEQAGIIKCYNKVWTDKKFPLQPSYHRLITEVYKGAVGEVDFLNGDRSAIVDTINSWAKTQTKGLLCNIIEEDDVDAFTRLLLVNAVYFKGTWLQCFKPHLTRDSKFQLLDGQTVSVPFMSGCKTYYHNKIDNFDLIRIPYVGGDISMYIFLPTEINEFQTLLQKIDSGTFLYQDFQLKESFHKLWIPKFNIRYHAKDLPSVDGFDNFSFGKTPLEPNNDEYLPTHMISHHSLIQVDEGGTVAAGATATRRCTSPGNIKYLVVDRPFLFMIREEKSKLIIFLGAVLDPSQHRTHLVD